MNKVLAIVKHGVISFFNASRSKGGCEMRQGQHLPLVNGRHETYTREDSILAEIAHCRERQERHKMMARRFRQLRISSGDPGYGTYWNREMRALTVLKQKIEDLEDQLIALRRGA